MLQSHKLLVYLVIFTDDKYGVLLSVDCSASLVMDRMQ